MRCCAPGIWQIGFVHHQQIGDFQHASLDRLHLIAKARRADHDFDVGEVRNLDFGLSGANRFDNYDIYAACREKIHHRPGGARHSAKMAAGS